MRFSEIDFGPDDAKGDRRLSDYFIRIEEYENVRSGNAWLVIGRKGTGKTAICEMIYNEAERTSDAFAVLLSFKNLPTSALFASSDHSYRAPNEYISIWRFLIALETVKLVLRDESVGQKDRKELQEFLEKNFGHIDVHSLDAVAVLREQSWKVGLSLPIDHLPGAELRRGTSKASFQQVHFGRAAAYLLERIRTLPSTNRFYLLFDELDEDYRKQESYFHLLISLLKACYQIRHEMRGNFQIWPIVVLRDDIFQQLDDGDLNKLDETTVNLVWSGSTRESQPLSLRRLVNERIRADGTVTRDLDAWIEVVENKGADDLWRRCIRLTMDRPRDILKLLKCCRQYSENDSLLSRKIIRKAIGEYGAWLYKEVGNEIYRDLPEYRVALGVLGRLGRRRFTLDMWRAEYGKAEEIAEKYRPDHVWVSPRSS